MVIFVFFKIQEKCSLMTVPITDTGGLVEYT